MTITDISHRVIKERYPLLPWSIKEIIDMHVEHGTPGGSFVDYVLKNDLKSAVMHADMACRRGLGDIALYIHWEIPSGAHGSPEKVAEWRTSVKERTE